MSLLVRVIGAGVLPFTKPGFGAALSEMGAAAVIRALEDSGLDYSDIQQAFVGHVYGDSTSGQAALYGVGMSGIPVFNVNNNCASGSSALYLGVQAIRAGADCVLVLGMEQMLQGALRSAFPHHESPLKRHGESLARFMAYDPSLPVTAQFYAAAAREYLTRHDQTRDVLGSIVAAFRQHAQHNPIAVFRERLSAQEVLNSTMVCDPITRLQCCAPTCGAAAVVLGSRDFALRRGLLARSPAVRAISLMTDLPPTFESGSAMTLMGSDETLRAAKAVYEASGLGAADCQVIELHDSFAINAVVSIEALGLAAPGQTQRLIREGHHTYGGRWVVNPSGGLISKGHPLGATGVAQVVELVQQLRGEAGLRQVPRARAGLAHNQGIGGATVVSLLTVD
jgi:acetyl-CoA acetyltransferase